MKKWSSKVTLLFTMVAKDKEGVVAQVAHLPQSFNTD
jgi:hypothetical protein